MEENGTRVASEEVQNLYFNFYRDLIFKVFDFSDEIFVDEVIEVRHACHVDRLVVTHGQPKPWLEFEKKAVRCAYLLRYSVLNTISLAKHFLESVTFGSEMLDKFLTESTLKIVCFGAGSGTELVGIVKTVNDFLKQREEELRPGPLQICFTVFDRYKGWQAWTTALVKQLRSDSDLCCKRNVDVRMRFHAVDLNSEWDEDTVKAVKKADILTMVKFVSAFCEDMSDKTYDQKKDLKLLTKIAHTVKLGARIFFLDYAGGWYYQKLEKCYEKCQFLEKITTNLHQSHLVHIHSEELRTGASVLEEMLGKRSTKISSCLWLKRIPQATRVKKNRKKVSTQKKSDNLIEKGQDFPVAPYMKHRRNLLK